MVEEAGLAYVGVNEVRGPLLLVQGVRGVSFGENVRIMTPAGEEMIGRVLEIEEDKAVVQVFREAEGLSLDLAIRFTGEPFQIPVSDELLGRVFSGSFKPLDHMPMPIGEDYRDINGSPINPAARDCPNEPIQTGISAIDGMNTLVRGQKLGIFTEYGLPHNMLVAQIARQSTVVGKEEEFAVVLATIGVMHHEAEFFIRQLEETGAILRAMVVLNRAGDPALERLLTPRIALTIAEYLAFDLDMHVLVLITDMTNYGEALREVAVTRKEVLTRRGYPGYLYSDLASLYERCGRIRGRKGSVTQLPVVTMPGGDITHPIPDLTGYITEGQLILDRSLHARGIYPPLNVLPSLSRLMKDGIGAEKTREDHRDVSNQLYMAYAEGVKCRGLARIVGVLGLTERERVYLKFAEEFEKKFVSQGFYENRPIERTLEIAWDLLAMLPEYELIRVRERYIEKYHPKHRSRPRVAEAA